MTTDARMLALAAQGNPEAFTALYEAYERMVFRIALRFVGNKDDAMDVAQDVWVKVYGNLGGFESRSRFSTWLYQVTRNRAIDLLRRRRKRAEALIRWVSQTPDPVTAPELVEQDSGLLVTDLLSRLPDRYRQVFVHCHLEGRSLADVAASMGVSIGTVKSRLHRARLRMREEVDRLGVAV
ncbi:MAG: RNA polymerase sigma factor [Bacillota bacterium]